jgi:hypothetical protein
VDELTTREIIWEPAFDKRSKDPKENFGIHGVTMRWIVKGDRGAVQWVVYTNWYLPHVVAEWKAKGAHMPGPIPADLGYHSPVPFYEDQQSQGECKFLDGKVCYYDGSGLNANPLWEKFIREGGEAVWKELEDYYIDTFYYPSPRSSV